ncbi:metal-dependent transcriptional regulator [Halomarina halobia]|uniref:Metal-dependent transcriptional regulator n=1 Tax=Halomarina halobia TaxID=3033386 RepID=A0ABD6ADE3_9EURY|nr:metal-dependent transcriptional regulator [Halomarina sp. PSR21]
MSKTGSRLKSIPRIQDGDTPVAPSAVATSVGVGPPTVTETLQRVDDGLVAYEPYRGARLTERGEKHALEALRHHRLLELSLTEESGYDRSEVRDGAGVLERHIGARGEGRIADRLGVPTVDSHGEPIPTTGLEIQRSGRQQPLAQCQLGDVAAISGVRDGDPDVLTDLGDASTSPGTALGVVETAPFGMVTVEVESTAGRPSLPAEPAASVSVSRPGEAAAGGPERRNEMT